MLASTPGARGDGALCGTAAGFPPRLKTIFQPLLRKLDRFVRLDDAERDALCSLTTDLRKCEPQENLALQGQRPEGIVLVLSGFAIRYKLLTDGRRQIVGFCLPGDLCDIRVGLVREMDHSIAALSPLLAGVILASDVHAVMEAHPRLARGLWWTSFVEESIAREWIVNVGYRSAFERLAHLFCELYFRLEAVGLAREMTCELPIRQSELADTLALSAVHVNRTLMELRRSGMMSLTNRRLVIHDMPRLKAAAGFEPGYLHLDGVDDAMSSLPLP
jgi:CRP-like cAMP-binding protein